MFFPFFPWKTSVSAMAMAAMAMAPRNASLCAAHWDEIRRQRHLDPGGLRRLVRPRCDFFFGMFSNGWSIYMAMDQYLLIPFLGGWTSIYQLFWGSLGTRVLTHSHIYIYIYIYITIYILPSGSLMVFNGIYSYLMELYSDSMGYKWDIPSGDLT